MSEVKYIIEENTREELQKHLNQWKTTGYTIEILHFIRIPSPSGNKNKYCMVVKRTKGINPDSPPPHTDNDHQGEDPAWNDL